MAFTHPAPAGPLLGFALFSQPVDLRVLTAALENELPGGIARHTTGGGDTGRPESPLLAVDAQGVTILVAPLDVPVPDGAALAACHPLWWTDPSPVETHTNHVVVTAYREPGEVVDHDRALHEAVMLSMIATIVLGLPGAVGLLYGAAGITFPAEPYCQLVSESLDQGRLPVEAWVSVWLVADDDDRPAAYTVGLEAFGHADLVIEKSEREPPEIFALLMSLAAHMVTSGDRLLPGATVGPTEDERFEVVEASFNQSAPMLRILY